MASIDIQESGGGYYLLCEKQRVFVTDAQLEVFRTHPLRDADSTLRDLFAVERHQEVPWGEEELSILRAQAKQVLRPTLQDDE